MSTVDAGLSRQATRLFQGGHYAEAERLYRRLVAQDPGNWQFALMLGLCRHTQGDLNEALKWVEKSVELGDGQPATHYYLGRLHTDSGKPALAREQFAQAIALDPNHVDARTGMGIVSLGVGRLERAVSELKVALRARADHSPALAALAWALIELDRIKEAWPHALRAVEVDPNNPMAQDVFGRVLMRAGRMQEAEKAFNKSLELNPERAEVHAELARLLALQRRDREALEQYGRAMAGRLVNPQLVIDASISLERVGDLDQARSMLGEACKRWPQQPGLVVRLAELEMLSGATQQALDRLQPLDSELPEVVVLKARIADAAGDGARARELLEPLIAADEEQRLTEARMLLADLRAYAAPEQAAAARAPIAPMLDRKVPLPDAVLTWAVICERIEQHEQAIDPLERLLAAELLPQSDRKLMHNRLGTLLDRAGKRAQAWANWHRGDWREAPHAPRLKAQRESGVLDRWLEDDWQGLQPLNFDDQRPTPVIIAGWPGSGREILISALVGHKGIAVLDPRGMDRRLEALGVPVTPNRLREMTPEMLGVGRKRFLRGVSAGDATRVLFDSGWWQASAIPALLRAFPDVRIVWPASDVRDLAVQWRVDGYTGVEPLVEEYRRELRLWNMIRERMAPRMIEFDRDELLQSPDRSAARMFEQLGLESDADAEQAARDVRAAHPFIPAGHGARYSDISQTGLDHDGEDR